MDATLYWSRFPGNFVKKETGQTIADLLGPGVEGPKFTGSPREWYETLVETIIDCIQRLQDSTFAKYGRAKRVEVNVYVHPDVGCILQTSVLFKLPPDDAEPTDKASRPIGRFNYQGGFNVHEDTILSNDTIRVVATFDTDDGVDKTMYGNVKVLDMPEGGRKP